MSHPKPESTKFAVEEHWLGQLFRVNVRLDLYRSGAASLRFAQAG